MRMIFFSAAVDTTTGSLSIENFETFHGIFSNSPLNIDDPLNSVLSLVITYLN